jgi:hypothetical protein
MHGEFSLHGVFIPTLLGLMLLAFALQNCLRVLLIKAGAYRHLWHPPLFNLALYVLVLGGLFELMQALYP